MDNTWKPSYFIVGILFLVLAISGFPQERKLVLRKMDNSVRMVITEQGDMQTTNYIKQQADPIQARSSSFNFKKDGEVKLSVSADSLEIKKELIEDNLTPAQTEDFTIHTTDISEQDVEQASIGANNSAVDGDLRLKGKATSKKASVSSVVYVRGEGVFVQDEPDEDPQFAYANIDGEGRTEYVDNTPATNYYYIKDHLGSTRLTIDEWGNQIEHMAYSAYGVEYELARGPGGPTREKFTGKEFDRDGMYDDGQGTTTTGINLQYFGFRYYDPEVGIWTSGDPMDEFWNSYSYVGGNPVNFIDPDGLMFDNPGFPGPRNDPNYADMPDFSGDNTPNIPGGPRNDPAWATMKETKVNPVSAEELGLLDKPKEESIEDFINRVKNAPHNPDALKNVMSGDELKRTVGEDPINSKPKDPNEVDDKGSGGETQSNILAATKGGMNKNQIITGIYDVAFGIGLGVTGGALILAPEPTTGSKIAGTWLIMYGMSSIVLGVGEINIGIAGRKILGVPAPFDLLGSPGLPFNTIDLMKGKKGKNVEEREFKQKTYIFMKERYLP